MAKRTKKLSRPQLKLEALEQRQLLAGITGGGTEVGSNINHANGNVYDQVLMTGSSVTITADAGQVTRVSFLDLQGDIVQAEFSGKGSLTISLDQFTKDVAPAQYNQDGVKYAQGLASFSVSGSDSSTNFAVFSVGKGNAVNQALFDLTHQGGDHTADIARLTIVADPANPNGSDFGAIYAGNAKFSADSGVVGITASNVQVQSAVRIGDVDAKTSATPTLVFGTHSQFAAIDVAGGDLISTNGKAINNKLSYEYSVNLLAGTDSNGTTLPAQIATPPFTDHDPFAGSAAKTLSLTSGNDAGSLFLGTSGDDTYIAAIGSDGIPTSGTTLNPGDALNGGGGNDTLSLSISGTNTAAQTTASFTANNIEWLSIANFETSTFGSTIDLASVPQLKAVTVTSSSATGDTTLSSIQGIVSATLKGGAGDLTLGYATAVVAGTADVQALTASGVTGGTFTANGIETLNVTSDTGANTLTLAGDKLKTITIVGDKSFDLGNLSGATSVTKVDASGLTAGAITLTADQAKDYNLIGGAGDDAITISTGYTSADTVNGGAGADTLTISSAIASAADLKNISNVETLKVTGAASNITLADNVGPTTFDLSDKTAQALTLTSTVTTKYTNDTWVTLTGDTGSGDKIDNSNAGVKLVVNANTTDVTAATTIVGGDGSDTLNLVAKGAGSLANVSGVEKIVVTGSTASTITFGGVDTVVASGKTLTIDGSAASAALTIDATGETNGLLSITTGSGKDVITAGTSGKDTIVSGSGDDKITIGAITATNVITGGDGNDKLTVSSTDIADAGKLVGVTGVETLALGSGVDLTVAAPLTATTGITTIDISDAGDNVLTLKSGYTDALKVVISGDTASADKIDNSGANVALTVEGNVADIAAATTIKGGSGTDILNLKADKGTADLTAVSGVESIVIGLDSDHPDYGATVTMGAVNTLIAAGKTLKVDASALTNSSAVFTFNGTTSETDGFVSVTGGAGADVISGTNSGFDTLIGGGGNDSITLGTLNATNVVSGGDGADTLTVTTTIPTSSSFLGVTGIETLKLGSGTAVTLTSNITATTGITTIDASDASDNVITIASGVTDSVKVVLTGDNANADKIVNSANTSLTVVAGVADIDNTTTITGGTGTDVLQLKAAANNDAANLSAVTGVETITVAKSAGNAISITVGADTVVAAGKTLTIDASATTDAATINGSAETDGSLVIKGGSAADAITGGGAADTFTGNGGTDTFNVAAHANKLTFDVVTDASTGDILNTTNKGTEVFGATEKVKISLGGLATFSDYLDAAAAGDGSTNGIYRWFQYGGNTYLVFDVSLGNTFQSNADAVIQLTGDVDLSAATLGDHTITIG